MTSPSSPAPVAPAEVVPTGPHRPRGPGLPTSVVVVLLAAVVVLTGLLLPAVGQQLSLSATRRPGTWTELYFARDASSSGVAGCARDRGGVTARFTIVNHVEETRTVGYRVLSRPARAEDAARSGVVVREGSRSLAPGEAATVSASLPTAARGAHLLEVRLPSTGAAITARCGGGGA